MIEALMPKKYGPKASYEAEDLDEESNKAFGESLT
jgi:hypothetical protein